MRIKFKKRLISLVCIICMLSVACLNEISVWAGNENPEGDITLETAPEKDFSPWTFSDVGIADDNYTGIWDKNKSYTNGKSLDETIFQGNIYFPTESFGNFYIGNVDPSGGSLWRGFVISANGNGLNFGFVGTGGNFYNETGNTGSTTTGLLATFDPDTAGTTLRGNTNLKVSFSVEYTSEADGLVTMKVGVFFDGKLYDNTYYTVKDVPAGFLTQTIVYQMVQML